ncbi:MAG TPA: cytochrome c [Candidatus Paceibacterota bacterium]|nr:cytochrome c [Verrucomicrobiota bacterium]HOX03229.1 cytochrome c [Verrucomicrobiota bacterium]HRZ46131.1 cytochrome c [Candidatus Paceibacterota bacterium]HRZ94271.1 cytochrome c [Candidatus Paceibacterota bacterium]
MSAPIPSNTPAPEEPRRADPEGWEPTAVHRPLSVWMILAMGGLMLWGGWYLARYSAGFHPLIYDERSSVPPPSGAASNSVDLLIMGKRLYADTCAKCHQVNGEGVLGQYPPLAGSEWATAANPTQAIAIIFDGLQGPIQVKGITYNNPMVAWRDLLSDTQIAALLTYIRQQKSWSHRASAVTPEQVAAVRAATKHRPPLGPWTAQELPSLE